MLLPMTTDEDEVESSRNHYFVAHADLSDYTVGLFEPYQRDEELQNMLTASFTTVERMLNVCL
jgi:hypothetical protein